MNFLKRSFYSLMHSKYKNIIIASVFSVIFFANVICMTILQSTGENVSFLEGALKNSVTVKYNPMSGGGGGENFGLYTAQSENEFKALENNEFVEDIIYYAYGNNINFNNAEIYIPPLIQEMLDLGYTDFETANDMWVIGLSSSQKSNAFVTIGYELIKGGHFDENDENACIVSEEFANLNGLSLGDTLEANGDLGEQKLVVGGIYRLPKVHEDRRNTRDIMFVSEKVYGDFFDSYIYTSATVFLKDVSYRDEYIDYVKQHYEVLNVYDSHFGNNEYTEIDEVFRDKNETELVNMISSNTYMDIYLNDDWYEMTVSPLEIQLVIFTYIVAGLQVVSAMVLIIFSAMLVSYRKREYGILLSLGETKPKICLQVLTEYAMPFIVGSVIGIVFAMLIGTPFADYFCNSLLYESQAETQSMANDVLVTGYQNSSSVLMPQMQEYITEIVYQQSTSIKVLPKIDVGMDLSQILIFTSTTMLVVLFSAVIQLVNIIRFNPAQILMNRKE